MDSPTLDLLSAVESLQQGDTHSAEQKLNAVAPQSTWARQLLALIHKNPKQPSDPAVLSDLHNVLQIRLEHESTPPPPERVPFNLIQLSQVGAYALLVDVTQSRLYVYQQTDSGVRFIEDFYVSIGKAGWGKQQEGDKRTPIGVYWIGEQLDTRKLGAIYGRTAFTLDYPNAWDQQQKHTGYGIWIHGNTTGSLGRAPQSSDGCITLDNRDIEQLARYITLKETPVIITADLRWTPPDFLAQRAAELTAVLNKPSPTHPATLANLSLLSYPGDPYLVVAHFTELSGNTLTTPKRQYWRHEPQGWKRELEEPLPPAPANP